MGCVFTTDFTDFTDGEERTVVSRFYNWASRVLTIERENRLAPCFQRVDNAQLKKSPGSVGAQNGPFAKGINTR